MRENQRLVVIAIHANEPEPKWKLIRADGLPPMLYNVEADCGELKDLSKAMPERVSELSEKLKKWEGSLMEPLWQEGKGYIKIRKNMNEKFRDAGKVPETLGALGKS